MDVVLQKRWLSLDWSKVTLNIYKEEKEQKEGNFSVPDEEIFTVMSTIPLFSCLSTSGILFVN